MACGILTPATSAIEHSPSGSPGCSQAFSPGTSRRPLVPLVLTFAVSWIRQLTGSQASQCPSGHFWMIQLPGVQAYIFAYSTDYTLLDSPTQCNSICKSAWRTPCHHLYLWAPIVFTSKLMGNHEHLSNHLLLWKLRPYFWVHALNKNVKHSFH